MKYKRFELIERLEHIMNDELRPIKDRIKAAKSLIRHKQDSEYTELKVVPIFENIMENDEAYSIEATNFLISISSMYENNFIELDEESFET